MSVDPERLAPWKLGLDDFDRPALFYRLRRRERGKGGRAWGKATIALAPEDVDRLLGKRRSRTFRRHLGALVDAGAVEAAKLF